MSALPPGLMCPLAADSAADQADGEEQSLMRVHAVRGIERLLLSDDPYLPEDRQQVRQGLVPRIMQDCTYQLGESLSECCGRADEGL